MTQRIWDRVGAASGAIAVALAIAGIAIGRAPGLPPAYDASTDEILRYMTRSPAPTVFVGEALQRATFVLLLLFFAYLWATLRTREGSSGWLSTAGLAGGVVYVVLDWSRFIVSAARDIAGAHLEPAEAVGLFDLSNALTPFTWTAIAMFLVPSSLVAVQTRALPNWLGWTGLLIGVANLVYGWLPPQGLSTAPEFAFLLWVVVTSLVLLRRPFLTSASRSSGVGAAT